MVDLCILGAGVIGAALAYEFAHYELDILWLEKENDVAMAASRANSAIIHGGYDPLPTTHMGRMNAKGAKRCFERCRRLDVEHRKTGAMVLAFSEADCAHLEQLYQRGLANGVPGLCILDREAVLAREPEVAPNIQAALWVPESGVMNPWDFALAMGEVAVRNGVRLERRREVVHIEALPSGRFRIEASDPAQGDSSKRHVYEARMILNATGVQADRLHNLVAEPRFRIQPTRGAYTLLDQAVGPRIRHVLFQCPGPTGKGVLVMPTMHGNLLIGPDAERVQDPEDTSVTAEALARIEAQAQKTWPALPKGTSIRQFAGVRANSDVADFILDWACPGFYDVAGIRSPGLSAAPEIASHVRQALGEAGLPLKLRRDFVDGRQKIRFHHLTPAEQAEVVRLDPLYGRVICRCETVTEGEIRDACASPIPPCSIDGIKRRAGTGLGRCQGGFCSPKVLNLLATYLGCSPLDVPQDGDGSQVLVAPIQEVPDEML